MADRQRSTWFYTSLGYDVVGEAVGTELGTLTMLKLPGDEFVSVELVEVPAHRHTGADSFNHLVISVTALDEVLADLAARGIDVKPPSSPGSADGPRTAWVTDPDGVRIELVQWPPGHPAGMTRADFAAQESKYRRGEHRG